MRLTRIGDNRVCWYVIDAEVGRQLELAEWRAADEALHRPELAQPIELSLAEREPGFVHSGELARAEWRAVEAQAGAEAEPS